jgi:putative DNA primase/helicase
MTTQAPATVPLEVFQREREKRIQAERSLEDHRRWHTNLTNEVQWYHDTVFNPSYNDTDMRLMVLNTPREMRMGLTHEGPENIVYFPKMAEQAHSSDKTVSKRLRDLAKKGGAFSVWTAPDPESGNPRTHVVAKPPAATPAEVVINRAQRGGSTWEDGKRVKHCKNPECGSDRLVRVTKSYTICEECGTEQPDSRRETIIPVNDIPQCQYDGEDTEQQEESHSQYDGEPQEDEISKLPCNVYTQSSCCEGVEANDTPHRHIDAEPPIADILPELKARRIWTCMRLEPNEETGKINKVPYIADLPGKYKASSTKPSTWRTYEYTVDCYEKSQSTDKPFDGIMFMCDDTFTFMDQDHCRNKETGEITQEAMERARCINSYTEESFSGDGIHTYAWGKIPQNRKRSDIGVEMYDHARPCVFTGKPLAEFPLTMEHRQEEIQAMHSELFPEPPKVERLWNAPSSDNVCSRSDEEILEKARSAPNGAKFRALYDGNTAGYGSQSEADLALCRMLAYWTDNTVSTIDRLFQQSGLMRDKWERNVGGGETYGERTIRIATGQRERRAS